MGLSRLARRTPKVIHLDTTDSATKPIRIAQVLAGAPIGGAENFYTRLVCALSQQNGIEQCAFTRTNYTREQAFAAADVPTSIHRFGGKLNFLDHYQYRKALKNWHPDIVLTFMNRATTLTPKGDYQLVARLGHYYKLDNYRHCDYWIGISKGICHYMIDYGFPEERVIHIPNFVDEAPAEPIARDSFSTPSDNPLLFAAGRLHTNKGFDVLLKAIKNIPEATLWLAGEGPEEQNLRSLTEKLNISSRVRFLGWRTDINALMRTADLFVCPSRHEGLGSIVPEAWHNRCPIVATRSQGPGELIDHGRTGLLVDIDDVDALSTAIERVLTDEKLQNRLIQAQYDEYEQHYRSTLIVERYIKLFQTLVS